MKTTEDYLKEDIESFIQNLEKFQENVRNVRIKQDLIDSYTYLAGYIIRLTKSEPIVFKTSAPSTELEYRCLRILKENGKMRQSTMMLWFKAKKYTKDDVGTALSSLLEKKLIVQDGLFYSTKEETKNVSD